jgi:hypothetical protein
MLAATPLLSAALALTQAEWEILEDVLRCYFSEYAMDSDSIGARRYDNLLNSLWEKRLIDTGIKHHPAMDIVPTPLCLSLYGLVNWVDFEPRNASSARMARRTQLPLFVDVPDYG